jgi:hypothetical protein
VLILNILSCPVGSCSDEVKLLGISQFPQDLEAAMDARDPTPQNTAAREVTSAGKKSSRQMIASGLLLVGSIVCLSRGRCNRGAQLAMALFLKKAFKQEKESGSSTSRGRSDLTRSRR